MISCGVILTSRVSIFRRKRPTTFELCYAIFKISATDRRCFFYEEAVITTDFSHIGSSAITCCFPIPLHFLVMSIRHLTFDGSAFIRAAFLVARPLFNLSPTFQGTHEEVAALLNLAHPYMVSSFFFAHFVFIKLFKFSGGPSEYARRWWPRRVLRLSSPQSLLQFLHGPAGGTRKP